VGQPSIDRSLVGHFALLEDPRDALRRRHKLIEMVVIAIAAVPCGGDGWVAIAAFGRAKEGWLRQFLELPHGIPSHDTFGRVFALLAPAAFEACFRAWVEAIRAVIPGEVIALDGKTLRRSHDRAAGLGALHLVSAWACANRVVLGQVATEAKSNEITAIPQLLALLHLEGCIVNIDAMGCQTRIAAQIIAQGGDYLRSPSRATRGRLSARWRRRSSTPMPGTTRGSTRRCWRPLSVAMGGARPAATAPWAISRACRAAPCGKG